MATTRLYHHNNQILLYYYLLFSSYFINYLVISEHGSDSVIERKLSSRIVNTKNGALRGYIATLPETSVQEVEVFLGIPFALPPVGKLRWMPPVSSSSWTNVRLAHSPSPVCPQNLPHKSSYSNSQQNDFHHNTPRSHWRQLEMSNLQRMLRNQSEGKNKSEIQPPRPVIVFIHGESFEWGSGSVLDGTALSAYGDILVVTINYRLGALGFFPSLDGQSRGNFGLMDQIAALHWIQENIAVFNGDPNSVTLIGHGNGAISVHLLMISNMAKGLFQRVIMMSGSAYSPWSFSSNPLKYAYQLVEKVNCAQQQSTASQQSNQTTAESTHQQQQNSNSQIMQCLRSKNIEQLLSAQRQIQAPPYLSAFGPTIDGLLISNNLNQIFNQNLNNFLNTQFNQQFNNQQMPANNHPNHLNSQSNLFNNLSITTFQSFTSLTSNSASSIPLLIGLSRLDMRWAEFEFIFSSLEDRRNPLLLREKAIKGLIKSLYSFHLNEIYLTVNNEYTDWSRNSAQSLFDNIIETISDATIVAPLIRTALLHQRSQRIHKNYVVQQNLSRNRLAQPPTLSTQSSSKTEFNSSTYFYCFSYLPDLPNQSIQDRAEPTHGSELYFLFGHPLLSNGTVGSLGYFPNRRYTRDEQNLSRQMIAYWANFVRSGNPNSPDDNWSQINSFLPHWPPYDEQQQYLSISPKSKVRDSYHSHRISFWLNLIPKLHISGALDNKLHLIMNSVDHHDWSQLNASSTTASASLLDSLTDAYSGQLFLNENISMQKSINNSNKNSDKLPSNSNILHNNINNNINNNSTRILQSDHHYQKHQPQQTHANKLLTTKSEQSLSSSNFVLNNQQQSNLLKKHIYTNNLDPLNLFHLPEKQDNHLDNQHQITYEQAKNGEQMLNYYSKALMLTIISGILMFILNISIFIILMNRKSKQNKRQKQIENDEQQQQKQTQQQQTSDHLKMINSEELVYDDYLEHNQTDQLKKISENKISKNSVYNLQQNSVTLHEPDQTDLKWYTTNNHHNEPTHHLPLNITNWQSNNYLLFEQHPEANTINDLANYTTNTLTNIDLNTLAIDTLNGKLVNEVGANYADTNYNNGHYERERQKISHSTSIKQHLNETDI